MLEKIIEVLLSLLLGAAGAAGVGTAAEVADSETAGMPASVAEKVAWAKQRAHEVGLNENAETEEVTVETDAVDGLETAAAALEEARELAPEAATFGLDTAWESVTTAPNGNEGAGGAPADLPGPPEGTPSGAPSELPTPPETPGRP